MEVILISLAIVVCVFACAMHIKNYRNFVAEIRQIQEKIEGMNNE